MALLLLAEDETLIGFDLEDAFRAAGYDVAGPFVTCAAAISWLKQHSPTVAVIDNMLQDGPCKDLALELRARGVPFLVYSGREQSAAGPEFAGVPWIVKPARFMTLIDTVQTVLLIDAIDPLNAE